MKHLIITLAACVAFAGCVQAQSGARPVQQLTSTDPALKDTLTNHLATGGKTLKISSTGTLEFSDGGTITGKTFFRDALGLGSLATQSTVTSSLIADGTIVNADISASAGIALSKLAISGTPNGLKFLRDDGSWQAIDLSGFQSTSGTLALGGFSSVTGVLAAANGGTGLSSLGSGVAAFLGTPSSANLASAVTGKTGLGALVFGTSPTFTTSIVLTKAGESDAAGLKVVTDPGNPDVRALYILPPAHMSRVYFGDDAQGLYAVNFAAVAYLESVPAFDTRSGLRVGGVINTFVTRGLGGLELGANHPTDYGMDVFQAATWSDAVIADRALNVHRVNGVTYFGSSTSRTNYEGLNLGMEDDVYHLWTVAGSGGGTARELALGVDETEKMRLTNDGVSFGGGAPVRAILHAVIVDDEIGPLEPQTHDLIIITVTGAEIGDSVVLAPSVELVGGTMMFFGWVSEADTVSIRAANFGATDQGGFTGDFGVTVIKH